MTVDEFVAFITQHMTAEEALKKLIASALIQYEHLKFDKEKGEPVHPLIIVTMAALDMGWQIAVENKEGDVEGIALGTEKYMNNLFERKESPMPKADSKK